MKLDGEAVDAETLDLPVDGSTGSVLQVGKRRYRRLERAWWPVSACSARRSRYIALSLGRPGSGQCGRSIYSLVAPEAARACGESLAAGTRSLKTEQRAIRGLPRI